MKQNYEAQAQKQDETSNAKKRESSRKRHSNADIRVYPNGHDEKQRSQIFKEEARGDSRKPRDGQRQSAHSKQTTHTLQKHEI